MHELLPFIVAGVASGSIYGMVASGLVLTYKTSGIFNFGQGALATAAAYVFYAMHYANHINWGIALLVSVLVVGPLMGLGMERISRRLVQQAVAWKIVGTVGLILVVQGLGTVKYGADTDRRPAVSSAWCGALSTWRGEDPQRGVDRDARRPGCGGGFLRLVPLDPIGVSPCGRWLTTPIFWPCRRRTRYGSAPAPGLSARTFAALSGVLVLPFLGLNAVALTYLVVQAFGAAVFGAFSSIPLTYGAAILLEIAAKRFPEVRSQRRSAIGGSPTACPSLCCSSPFSCCPAIDSCPAQASSGGPALQWQAPPRVRVAGGIVAVGLLALVPEAVGAAKINFYTIGLSSMILLLSLGLLVKTLGQVSLCQATFAAIGAVAFSQLTLQGGIPWFVVSSWQA